MHWDSQARYLVIEQLVRAKLAGGDAQLDILDEETRVQRLIELVLRDPFLYPSYADASYDADPVERIVRRVVKG